MGKQDYHRSSKSSPSIGWELFILKWIGIAILLMLLIGLFLPDEEIVVEKLNPEPVEYYWEKAQKEAIRKGTYQRNRSRGDQPKSRYKVHTPWPAPEPDVWIEMEKDGYNDIID